MAPFDTSHTSSYSSSVVTMAVSCTVFEISYTLVEKRQFFIPLPFNLHDQLEALRILIQTAQVSKLLDGAKILPKSSTLWIGFNNVTDDRRTAPAIRAGTHWRQSRIRFCRLRQCRPFVAVLSKVDCRWLVRLCRTTIERQLIWTVGTLWSSPYKLATKSNSTACRGRRCRQSWTCSTRSTLSKAGYFWRQIRSTLSNSTKSTVSHSTMSPVCTGLRRT